MGGYEGAGAKAPGYHRLMTQAPPRGHFLDLEPRMRCVVALAIGVAGFFGVKSYASPATAIIAGWDGFALSLLGLLWAAILGSGIDQIRYRARTQDLSRVVIFFFTIAAACSSIFAVIFLLSAAKNTAYLGLHATLSILAVLASWTLVHTMFAMRYAHAFYGEGDRAKAHIGGLEFPSDDAPDYLDFAYFSFVIGMTCQVSDVQITAKGLRALALIHGVLSFCFNTVILALTINTLSGLL
jgi:uncharacterized membrane protein